MKNTDETISLGRYISGRTFTDVFNDSNGKMYYSTAGYDSSTEGYKTFWAVNGTVWANLLMSVPSADNITKGGLNILRGGDVFAYLENKEPQGVSYVELTAKKDANTLKDLNKVYYFSYRNKPTNIPNLEEFEDGGEGILYCHKTHSTSTDGKDGNRIQVYITESRKLFIRTNYYINYEDYSEEFWTEWKEIGALPAYLSTDVSNPLYYSDKYFPSVKAVKDYVDFRSPTKRSKITFSRYSYPPEVVKLSSLGYYVVTQSYGGNSIVDLSLIPKEEGGIVDIMNINGNSFKITTEGGSESEWDKFQTYESTFIHCIYVGGRWIITRMGDNNNTYID